MNLYTVGQLKAFLADKPDDMPIFQMDGMGHHPIEPELVRYTVNHHPRYEGERYRVLLSGEGEEGQKQAILV